MNYKAHVCSKFQSPSPLSPYTLTPVLFSTCLRYTASENNIQTKHRSPKKRNHCLTWNLGIVTVSGCVSLSTLFQRSIYFLGFRFSLKSQMGFFYFSKSVLNISNLFNFCILCFSALGLVSFTLFSKYFSVPILWYCLSQTSPRWCMLTW